LDTATGQDGCRYCREAIEGEDSIAQGLFSLESEPGMGQSP